MKCLTQSRLKEILDYDAETGIFKWSKSCGHSFAGKEAGCPSRGYLTIRIDGQLYFAHRLAWLYAYGEMPSNFIDHRDHKKSNNRIDNLRDVTKQGNGQNQIKALITSRTGFLGVYKDNTARLKKKFKAQINVDGKTLTLGRFATPEEAHAAYITAKRIHHPTCTI